MSGRGLDFFEDATFEELEQILELLSDPDLPEEEVDRVEMWVSHEHGYFSGDRESGAGWLISHLDYERYWGYRRRVDP